MDRSKWSPSIVLGIDFGMTCTGVAYSSEDSKWGEPQVIQYWPGHSGLSNKCPSQVAYNSNGVVVSWGHCTTAQRIATSAQYFKLNLDPSFKESTLSHEDATKFYIDYMSELNRYVNTILGRRFSGWHERRVEYRFSIPTTWTSPRLTHQLRQCLKQAGFVSNDNRRVAFTRTEAEAAAIYAADFVEAGDVFMVIDAGGATTDINVLKALQKLNGVNQMEALDKAEGINIGSVQIDQAAHELVTLKLEAKGFGSVEECRALAEQMMEASSFDIWKSDYGLPDCLDTFYLKIPPRNQQHITLLSSELKQIFDNLLRELIRFIRYKIHALVDGHPQELLQYIVLSGGLGSSAYLRQYLISELCVGDRQPRNARNLQIWQAEKPQLAVVKGLVKDRPYYEYPLPSSFQDRRARASYGLLVRAPYDSKVHFGQPTSKDELTGKIWVEQRIDWFIKEGDKVPEEGFKVECRLRVSKERRLEPFRCTIVTSDSPVSDLPLSMVRGIVTGLCTVYGRFELSDFETGSFQKVKSSLFGKNKDHNLAKFYLRVLVNSTGLGFELEALDGRRYSEETSNVEVVWEEGGLPAQAI